MLAAVYGDNLSSDVLPDGKMYFNIAERVIKPTMKQNYELISTYSAEVQELLNEKAGLHLGAVKSKINENRVDGIVERLSGEDDFDKAKWLLGEPVENFSQAVVDDTVKTNVETQYNAGLSPKVVRKGRSDGCSWCRALAGSYAYPDVPKDIYRRHEHCRCLVEYHPGDGRRQNVHTKKWNDPAQSQKVEQRKIARTNSSTSIEKLLFRKHANDTLKVDKELNRRERNLPPFNIIKLPMQKRTIKRVVKKYGIDISGLTIKIQREADLIGLQYFGAVDYDNIGRIDLFPNAFCSEEELVRTIIHERCHVKQLEKYGKGYCQNNLDYMEKVAYRHEEMKKYGIINSRRT